jgi:hypothetical protein
LQNYRKLSRPGLDNFGIAKKPKKNRPGKRPGVIEIEIAYGTASSPGLEFHSPKQAERETTRETKRRNIP